MNLADRASTLALCLFCLGNSGTRAEIIAASHIDYSNSGYVSSSSQNPVNGFTYGVYPAETGTDGSLSFASMQAAPSGVDLYWIGNEGSNTPAQGQLEMHPGLAGSTAVRRYTVSSGNEPLVSGPIRIIGRYFDLNSGLTHAFITVDPDGEDGPVPRSLLLAPTEVSLASPLVFDETINASPGTTIDFGVLAVNGASSDSTGFIGWIADVNAAVPTNLVSSSLGSPNYGFFNGNQDFRGLCYVMATDGVTGGADRTTFELTGGGYPYQYGGLLYLENVGSGKATRFESVRMDVTASNDFVQVPQLYVLRHNSDPTSINPVADDRYERLQVLPVRHTANSTGQPYYTFDLSTLPIAQRTGYGFAICGSSVNTGTPIVVSEISAVANRVSNSEVVPTKPFFVEWTNGHRYGASASRGSWEQVQTEAAALGGYLATFGSSSGQTFSNAAENAFVAQTFTDPQGWYIGLKQNLASPVFSEPAGGWEWINGEAMSYLNWNSSEPNHAFGAGEDYGMLLPSYNSTGTWFDTKVAGYPETSNYRGIIELPTLGAGERNFFLSSIHGRSNIFDAGLSSATQGGFLPPSITVAGLDGKLLRFPKIHGTFNTAADFSGPDGAHTPGRSCDLNAVGGISGYLNGNNTSALVGVFLGAAQPGSPPARLDFSSNQIGENFTTLAPALGQVFFIGDGLTNDGLSQQFTIPPGAEKLYFGYPDGNTGELYHGPPLGWGDNSGSISLRASIAADPVPTLGLDFPLGGGQLQVSGGTGPFAFTILSGNLPAGISLSSSGLVSGTAGNGPYAFTVKVTDANAATANRSFSGTIENPVAVPSSLVSWWAAENTLADMVGNNHGVMKNGPPPGEGQPGGQIYATGKAGRAFVFDGVNDFIQIPHDASQNVTGDLTIEGWIKPTANFASEPTIISKRSLDDNNSPYVVYLLSDGRLAFASRNGGAWEVESSPAPVELNQWSHVAVTISGGQLLFYVNGTQTYSGAYTSIRPEVTGVLSIGATVNDSFPESSPAGPFSGWIDELALYNRALDAQEISSIHLSGSGGKAHDDISRDVSLVSNPVGRWSYRQQTANALAGSYNPANATLVNGPNFSGPIVGWSSSAGVSFNSGENYHQIGSAGSKYDWLGHQFGMGPGSGSQFSVLRWIAPEAGQYAVAGSFAGADTHPTTVDVHIFHNSDELTPEGKRAVTSYRGEGVSHTQVITVAANDTVDFLVGAGGNGYSYDSTVVSASVTLLSVTPLPRIAVEQPVNNPLSDGSSTLSFGPVTLGGSLAKTITIRNTGTAPLTGLAATVDGTNAADFVVADLGTSTLAPGASVTVDVDFTPTGSGGRGAAMHVVSNDSESSPFDIELTGSGYSAVGNKLYAWGDNDSGELGDGSNTDKFTPVPVIMTGALASQQITQILATSAHSFAITAEGKVYGWGYNWEGALGDGTEIYRNEPVEVDMSGALAGKTVTALAGSNSQTLALTSEGKVYSWGANYSGQLGLGDTTKRLTPQLVQGALAGKTIISIASNAGHSLVLASDGTLYAWGNNFHGELGDGTTINRISPVAVNTAGTLLEGKTIISMLCGTYHSVVLTSDGKVFAWGFNGNGYLGDGTTTTRPAPVAVNGSLAGKTVIAIAGSYYHHVALTSDNQLHAWGSNLYGELGDGTNTERSYPAPVNMTGELAGKTIAQIMAGGGSSMVRTTDGKLFGWGFNIGGQLGNGGSTDLNLLTAVDMSGALAGRTLVAASIEGYHTLVIAYAPPAPEIVVENEAGSALSVSGSPIMDFGPVLTGQPRQIVIKIRNTGDDLLSGISVMVDGAAAADFSVGDSGTTTLTPGGVRTLTLTFNPTTHGSREAILHIVSNDADEPAYTIGLSGTGGQPISAWREQYFETTANSGNAADDADPDNDGVTNLMEFATAGDPTDRSPVKTPLSPPVAGMIQFNYTRNKLASAELSWIVEWNDGLEESWSSNGVSETVTADDGSIQSVVVTLPAGLAGKRFVHLKVTRP